MIDLPGISVQFLGMPLSSAALFLLAGLLLGHLLWYRERSKKSSDEPELESRYIKLRSSLKQRKVQLRELQKQHESVSEDLTILQKAHSTLRSKNKRLEQLSRSSQDELNEFRHALNDTEIKLASEEKRNQTVIGQLQELIETNTNLVSENKNHQHGFQLLDKQYQECLADLEATHVEIAKLQQRADETETESKQQQQLISDLEQRNIVQDGTLKETEEALQRTQQDLVARCKDLDAIQIDREQLEENVQQQHKKINELETDLEMATRIQMERDEFANDLAEAAKSLSEQRQTLEQCEATLEQKNAQIHDMEKSIETTTLQLAEVQKHRLQLEQFNEACQNRLDELESLFNEKSTECQSLSIALGTARVEQTEAQDQIQILLNDLKQAKTRQTVLRTKITDLQRLVEQQEQQLHDVNALREEANAQTLELSQTRKELANETANVAKLQQQLAAWTEYHQQLETAQATIQQYHHRNSANESVILQQEAQITTLRQRASDLENLESGLKLKQAEVEQATSEIEIQKGNVLKVDQALQDNEAELASAIAEIHLMEKRIETMSEEFVSLATDNELLSADREQSASEIIQLRAKLEEFQSSHQLLEKSTMELLTVQQERDQLVKTRDGLEATVSRLGNQITTHLTETREIRECLSQKTDEYRKQEEGFHQAVASREATIAELKLQLDDRIKQHDAAVDDLAMKTVTMDDQQLKIEQLTSALENMESAHEETEKLETGIQELEKQHQELLHDYNLGKNRIAEQNHEMEKLTAELKTLESDRVERDQLQLEVTELKSHIECLREELEDSLDSNAQGQDRLRNLENQLHEHVQKIRELRRHRSSPSSGETDSPVIKPESDRKAA